MPDLYQLHIREQPTAKTFDCFLPPKGGRSKQWKCKMHPGSDCGWVSGSDPQKFLV